MEGINDNQNASYSDPVRQEPTIRTPMGGSSESPNRGSGKGFPKWIIAVIGIVLILGIGGFFIANSLGSDSGEADPSPTSGGLSTFPTPNSTSTPEPTEEPEEDEEVDKSEISIQVLNGTGTAGEASFLQGRLEDLGYEEVEAANADSQDETETTVTFSSDVPDSVVDEITEELEDIYTEVSSETGTVSGGFDIRILTGPRSGSATASPRASASPTASPSN